MNKAVLFSLVAVLTTVSAVNFDGIVPTIIQGEDSARGQFPFYVYLNVSNGENCGGSLIYNQWILTAAHCLWEAEKAVVSLGSLKRLDSNEPGRINVEVTSDSFYIFPEYTPDKPLFRDVALIELPEPVEISEVIKPIPIACDPKYNLDTIVIGNGAVDDSGNFPEVLQYTSLTVKYNVECWLTKPSLLLSPSLLCAKGTGQRSVRNGDFGGPLISAKDHILVGISNFDQGFASTAWYKPWVQDVTGNHKCQKVQK